MQMEKTRHSEPSYFRVLLAAGLIESKTRIEEAWGLWQRVCADAAVIRLSMRLEKVFVPSVAAPFQHGAQVLASLNPKELASLRQRIGA